MAGAPGGLFERAAALRPFLLEHRDAVEDARRLSDEVAAAVGAAGLFRAAAPLSVGGGEASIVEQLRAWEELARADSAVGWCAYNSAAMGFAAPFFAAEAREAIYAARDACFGFAGVDGGSGEPSGGGFTVSGKWPVVSGCHVSPWFLLACRLHREPGREAEPAMVVVRREDVTIEDTWRVGGMRGTGSNAIRVEGAQVLPGFVWWSGAKAEHGPWQRIPFRTAVSPAGAAVALGVAQAAIDALAEVAARRYSATTKNFLRDQPAVQDAIAESSGLLAAARAGFHLAAERLWACAERGEDNIQARAAYWASQLPVMKASIAVAGQVYEAGGADSMLVSNPLERALRDVHAINIAAQRWRPFVRAAGQVMLGLEPDTAI
jgi:alkylation response protein AidB-like acyl-CoA dehydrogenase